MNLNLEFSQSESKQSSLQRREVKKLEKGRVSSSGTNKRTKGRIDYKAYDHLLRHDNEQDENNASKSEMSKSSNAMEIDLMDDISSAPVSEERN